MSLRPKVTRARGRGTFPTGGTGDKRTGRRGRRPLRSKASPRSIRQRQRGETYKRFVVRRSAYILAFAGYAAIFFDMVRRAGSLETCGFKQTFWSLLGLRPKVTRARKRGTFPAGGTGDKRTGRRGRRPLRSKASPRSIRQRQRGQKYKRFPAEPFCAAVVIGERKSKNRRFLAAFFSIFLSLLKEIWPPEASKRKGSMSLRPKVTRARGRGTFPSEKGSRAVGGADPYHVRERSRGGTNAGGAEPPCGKLSLR